MSTLCGACVAVILFFAGLPVDAGRPAPQPDFSQKDYSKLESIREFWQLVLVRENQQPVGYMHTVVKKGLLGQTPALFRPAGSRRFPGKRLADLPRNYVPGCNHPDLVGTRTPALDVRKGKSGNVSCKG